VTWQKPWSWTQTYHFFHIHHDLKSQTFPGPFIILPHPKEWTATWIADWDWEFPKSLRFKVLIMGLFPNPKYVSNLKKKTRVFDRQLSGSQTVKQKKGVVFDIYSCCLLQLEVISKKTLTNVFPSDLDVSQLQYIIITKSYIITFPTLRPWSIQQNC